MKKKTKIRLKRTVAFVLCMMMVVSNLLVSNAATNTCPHKNYMVLDRLTKTIVSYDEGSHVAKYTEVWRCTYCDTYDTRINTVSETHSMNRYTDEGHSGDRDHTYRLYCADCGFSWLHTIYCSGGSSHAKP